MSLESGPKQARAAVPHSAATARVAPRVLSASQSQPASVGRVITINTRAVVGPLRTTFRIK